MAALVPLEDSHDYPGPRLIGMLRERLESGDAMGTARLIEGISMALMTRSYRRDPAEWEAEEDVSGSAATMPTATSEAGSRPYFEVLVVTPTPVSKWQLHIQQMRRLRRTQDAFVYEPVIVGSFEDAILGVALNANVQSVVIYEGFPYASTHQAPILRSVLSSRLGLDPKEVPPGDYGLMRQ